MKNILSINIKEILLASLLVASFMVPSSASAMSMDQIKSSISVISTIVSDIADSAMSASVIGSAGLYPLTVEVTFSTASTSYDVNQDGKVDRTDLSYVDSGIYDFPHWYDSAYDIDLDQDIDNDDFFILRNYLAANGDPEMQYEVRQDGVVDRTDLEYVNNMIGDYEEYNQYDRFGDIDQDGANDNDDFFILRNYLAANGDPEMQYEVRQDGVVDRTDLEYVNNMIGDYEEYNQYDRFGDIDQDGANDNDDFFILRNYLAANGDPEMQYEVRQDGVVDRTDLEYVNNMIGDYEEYNQYDRFGDIDQDGANDNDDFFILRNYLAANGDPEMQYEVRQDGVVDRTDLEYVNNMIGDYEEYNQYDRFGDIDQDGANDNDDFFILRNYLAANGDPEMQYEVRQDGVVDRTDLEYVNNMIGDYEEYNQYDRFGDIDQDGANTNNDYNILADYLGEPRMEEDEQRSLTITSPNGGETFTEGEWVTITWDSTKVDKVYLGYSDCDSCLSWIATDVPNTGSFDWYVQTGNAVNTQFKIAVTGFETGVGSVQDKSDDYFTVIQNPDADWQDQKGHKIQVTSPNGGETLTNGETVRITWDSEKLKGVNLSYSTDQWYGGNIGSVIPDTGYYDWTVNVPNSEGVQFKIYALGYGVEGGQVRDYSDEYFSIVDPAPPVVETLYPSGVLPKQAKEVYMLLTTDIPAHCSYSMSPYMAYDSMTPFEYTAVGPDENQHAQLLEKLQKNREINVYVKCKGFNGLVTEEDHIVSFSVGEVLVKNKRR